MILTLLASALGFVSSLVPQALKFLQNRQDNKQELAILELQIKQQQNANEQRLDEIQVQQSELTQRAVYQHDSSIKSTGWVNNLRASVRPFVTYTFFSLFCAIKICALYQLMQTNSVVVSLPQLWDEPTQAIFAAIISFWFGDRTLAKMSN